MKRLNGQTAGSAARRARTGGFSLVEVLLAIFILSIGLIMVASIFPVGAEWTRQNTEESLAQTIGENGISIVRSRLNATDFALVSGTTLQGVPGLINKVTANERSYQYGASQPFPAANPTSATYFWTVLARKTPGATSGTVGAISYDVYILVFKKGAAEQQFANVSTGLVANCRNLSETYMPCLVSVSYGAGSAVSGGPVTGAVPAMGSIGIGATSGTVFRQLLATSGTTAAARPALTTAGEQVIIAPAADGTTATPPAGSETTGVSPLVYVYQTTLSF
jgi:type II secretory pathway pseudopilin PulG